jgi:hypothetical protein
MEKSYVASKCWLSDKKDENGMFEPQYFWTEAYPNNESW